MQAVSNLQSDTESEMKHLTVGLLWHSLVSGNLGVGALTESNIAIIRDVAEKANCRVRFLVLGSGEGVMPELQAEMRSAGHDIEAHRVRIFRKSFRELVRRCDMVVDIGEGDSFADIYGFKRFFFYWLSKNIVCSLGRPLILAPQTIGPFDSFVARLMAKQVMVRCARVFTRDHLSSEYLNQLGVSGNTDEAIDVAFRLPYRPQEKVKGGKTKVGINVSGLLFNGGYTGGNQFDLTIDYAETVRKIVAQFAVMPNVEIHLIGHVIEPNMPVEDDLRAAQNLAKEFPSAVVAPAFKRPSDAKSYISGMDFFIGARMHACIAAFSSGVPVVPMAYSRKFNGLFGTLGYYRFVDCRVDSEKTVLQKIFKAFAERRNVAEEIGVSHGVVKMRLGHYEAALEEALGTVLV